MGVKDWQQRVLSEQNDLTNKIISLTEYIKKVENQSVPEPSRFDLLVLQLEAMSSYQKILKLRIAEFT